MRYRPARRFLLFRLIDELHFAAKFPVLAVLLLQRGEQAPFEFLKIRGL